MTATRPRVLFWDNLPSPYGVEQYNLLSDRGHLDLSVWFRARTEPDRSWDVDESSWRFPGAYAEDPGASLATAHRFARRCERLRPDVLVSPYGDRTYLVGHAIAKALGIRTILVVQRTFGRVVHPAWWREAAKRVLFRSAEAAQVPGPDGAAYAQRYGFPDDRIFAVKLTTNVALYSRGLSQDERDRHRARLGVAGCVFLYVGRMWKPKGLLTLLDAFRRARAVDPGISLLLVGDGVDEAALRDAADGVPGVVFRPFVQAADLYAYYAAADVFVFPTLGDAHGQVIEEAHAAGLPIITSDAVGDIRSRVPDGVSGFVVPAGDPTSLSARMLALAADPSLRASMGERGAARTAGWRHEVFAAEAEAMIEACLAAPRRETAAGRILSAGGRIGIQLAGASCGTVHREFP